MEIKVLGGGCARCKELHEDAKRAVAEAGLAIEVIYVTDIAEVVKYDLVATLAIVINGSVKAAGRTPTVPEMVAWFSAAAG